MHEKTEGEIISLDGKWLRGSFDKATGTDAVKMVSAWAGTARLVLAQKAIESGNNETATLPQLLKLLDVSGCIVTLDAAGCHKSITQQVVKKKGDSVLSLKGNHETVYEAVVDNFTDGEAKNVDTPFGVEQVRMASKGHGRVEIRELTAIHQRKRELVSET